MNQKNKGKYYYILFLPFLMALFLLLKVEKEFNIIEAHTHIESLEQAKVLLAANKKAGITKTLLVASPVETITLNGNKSFTGYEENFEELLKIKAKYPEKFSVFCTLNPKDPEMLDYLKECYEKGGRGIKLYNGHSYYFDIFQVGLDDPKMMEIYAFAEKNKMPLLFHVNIRNYEVALRNILDQHPNLVVSIPHIMVSSLKIGKVKSLLDDYPNLYTDISFGSPEFMASGFRRLSKSPEKYIDFLNAYSRQILFGADMVLTTSNSKNKRYMKDILNCYKNMLEKSEFKCSLVKDYYTIKYEKQSRKSAACNDASSTRCKEERLTTEKYRSWKESVETINGMRLKKTVLKMIYEENPKRFLNANQV